MLDGTLMTILSLTRIPFPSHPAILNVPLAPNIKSMRYNSSNMVGDLYPKTLNHDLVLGGRSSAQGSIHPKPA